jgi:hypothetical protein
VGGGSQDVLITFLLKIIARGLSLVNEKVVGTAT